MPPRRRKRVDPALFGFPVGQIRAGYFSDGVFARPRAADADEVSSRVMLQVTTTRAGFVSGVDEAVALLKLCADWQRLTLHALYEGDRCDAGDTVLTIEGRYGDFAHLAMLLVGVLSRRTTICTNAHRMVEAARTKPLIFLGVPDDVFMSQAGDGFAAYIGGVRLVSTEAQGALSGAKVVRLVPSSLVGACGGDAVRAARTVVGAMGEDAKVIASVTYDNDCRTTSVAVARALEGRLWGVALDTPETMVDASIISMMGSFQPTGVNQPLVWAVRNALDAEGLGEVKIVVAGSGGGGIGTARIRALEDEGAPADAYAVGRGICDAPIEFSANIVEVDGMPQARRGRSRRPNQKLERVK
jgi:nicotinate phosphoribosyltransferase